MPAQVASVSAAKVAGNERQNRRVMTSPFELLRPIVDETGMFPTGTFAGSAGLCNDGLVCRVSLAPTRVLSAPALARSTVSPGSLLALDLAGTRSAHRLALAARTQRAERFADLAVLSKCGAPRPACRADDRRATPRKRTPPRPRPSRPRRCSARRNRATRCCASVSIAAMRSSSLASTICTSVDQPSDCTPRKPERNAARSLPSIAAGSAIPEHEGAGHRPFARLGRALEHEGVGRIEPDGAQQLHLRGPPVSGSSHDDVATAHRPANAAPARSRPCAAPADRRSRRSRGATPLSGAAGAPDSSSRSRQSPCPARRRSRSSDGARSSRPAGRSRDRRSLRPRARRRAAAGPAHPRPARRCGSWRRTPATAAARSRRRRPAIASRTPPTSPPSTRIASGQSKRDRLLRRRMHRQRIGERGRAGIDGAPRLPQRLVRLQHHGELREVEAADMDQRAGALLGCDRGRMRHGVADLAQRHEAERRRQVEALGAVAIERFSLPGCDFCLEYL